MSKLLVVFAATGQQGGSVIDYVLSDPELKAKYKLRGVTRNVTSNTAKLLQQKGVEMIQCDLEQPETLKAALEGATFVFSNTVSVYDDRLYEREVTTGKAIADASVAGGAEYLIYSSSTPAMKFTGRAVVGFDSKFVVEEYIRTLPIKSAFYTPGAFMQNWHGAMKPRPKGTTGEYALNTMIKPDTQLPVIDIVGDTGKFVGAILAEPDEYEGKSLYAASEMLTLPQAAEIMGRVLGKNVIHNYMPEEDFRKNLPPVMQEPFCSMLAYMNDPGYYGPETQERVKWTQAQARGELHTYEKFLRANPINLD